MRTPRAAVTVVPLSPRMAGRRFRARVRAAEKPSPGRERTVPGILAGYSPLNPPFFHLQPTTAQGKMTRREKDSANSKQQHRTKTHC